ncbi:hypothetical protein BMF35_a0655 [Aurantiacibacter gangjinensis]|nr:hypothetical protein BMF35_a0655 [Aurantiacibacter gangjinensis]
MADRRRMLALAAAAIAAPAWTAALARPVSTGRIISPPSGMMRYTRTAIRQLGQHETLQVTRSFDVDFRSFEHGFMLHGQQVAARVEAPEALRSFGRLEEARDESALFPIALNAYGQILSSDLAPLENDGVAAAIAEAVEILRQQQLPQDERAQLASSIAAMQRAAQRVIAHLPTDIFAPSAGPRVVEQALALPGGMAGRLETRFAGESDFATGLMRSATREIVTEVEGSTRRAHERWSLTAI